MPVMITSAITASNGIVIAPSVLKFANGAVLSVGNSSIAYGNDSPIINADASFTFGTSVVNSSLITLPGLTLSGSLFVGGGIGGIINTQIFTANGTWTNPNNALGLNGNEQVLLMMWGGGGGGSSFPAGGGGAFNIQIYSIADVGNTATITVGPGGGTSTDGGSSVFTPTGTIPAVTVYGGGGANATVCGGGGGLLSVGLIGTGGTPLEGTTASIVSTFGGGGGGNATSVEGGSSIYGGGGGGSGAAGNGGSTMYSGAGGCSTGTKGVSVFGGLGGNSTVAATAPGGGGGTGTSNTGARGEVRIWVVR